MSNARRSRCIQLIGAMGIGSLVSTDVGSALSRAGWLYLNSGTAAPFDGVSGTDITTNSDDTTSVALGDVDGDGNLDLVAGNFNQPNRLYLNNDTVDADGVADDVDAFPTDPAASVDTDGDGMPDAYNANATQAQRNDSPLIVDTDDDNDGVADGSDAFPLDAAESVDTDSDGIGNNADSDDDNDGMLDSFEVAHGLRPLDSSDAALDNDGDGLTNLEEFQAGRNPIINEATVMQIINSILLE